MGISRVPVISKWYFLHRTREHNPQLILIWDKMHTVIRTSQQTTEQATFACFVWPIFKGGREKHEDYFVTCENRYEIKILVSIQFFGNTAMLIHRAWLWLHLSYYNSTVHQLEQQKKRPKIITKVQFIYLCFIESLLTPVLERQKAVLKCRVWTKKTLETNLKGFPPPSWLKRTI